MKLPSIKLNGFYSPDLNWEGKVCIDWYKHHSKHPWKGFSFDVAVVGYVGQIIVIWDGKEQYDIHEKGNDETTD